METVIVPLPRGYSLPSLTQHVVMQGNLLDEENQSFN